jgi:hypothetical protein
MKSRPTQFGVRENTASSRRHASRLVVSPPFLHPGTLSLSEHTSRQSPECMPPSSQTLNLSPGERAKGTTGKESKCPRSPKHVAYCHCNHIGIELGVRDHLRMNSSTKIDFLSTGAALEQDIRIAETDGAKQDRSDLL